MVVDDEFPIRKWFCRTMKNLPDIKVELVGAASNGEEALQLFHEKRPDVVFTDIKMPMMDGLELLREIKRERSGTEVIIITSYDEFAYAREAIAQNAYDYVLKTEANSRMLSDLLRRIQSSRQTAMDKDALALRFEQEIFLNSLLRGEKSARTKEDLTRHGISLNERAMFAAAFHTNDFVPEKMMDIFLNAGVENVLYYVYQKNIMIAIGNTTCIDQLAYQSQVIFQFAEKISNCFDSPVGVSGPYYQYEQLVEMILKSTMALNLSFYQGQAKRVYYAQEASEFETVREGLEALEQKVTERIQSGRMEYACGVFGELFELLMKRMPGDVGAVKQYVFRLMANVYQMVSMNRLALAESTGELYRSIERCADFEEMKNLVIRTLENLEDGQTLSQTNYSTYVAKAVRYIEKNYARIGNASDVARDVGLNVDYLCHLFKQETGVTFNQFLNSTRMNRAIWLLNNTQMKSYEIAEQVGYSNQGYFSRLFKQKFQMSPYEFRNMRGNGNA